jgi:glucan endo-1,3-alpha-glucosidase
MDMNVLPKWSTADGERLSSGMGELLRQEGYLRWKGRRVLSTFSGHDATFGGGGWDGWLAELNRELGEKVRSPLLP